MIRRLPILLCAMALAMATAHAPIRAQDVGDVAAAAPQSPRPEMADIERLRFVTDSDYPPFNYLDEDGVLTGFNVDLARAICAELGVDCDVRTRSWDAILETLETGDADAAIASLRIDADTLTRADFTEAYYHTPARFVARRGSGIDEVTPETARELSVAVVGGTAHEAYLRDFFPEAKPIAYASAEDATEAVRAGVVDLLFGDGISLMFWLNGTVSNACCEFRGGPFTEPRYFGEGIGIAVRQGNRRMRDILDYGLEQVKAAGRFEELLLRYFPMSVF